MMIVEPRFDPHIRSTKLRQDLIPIADLIELCFAEHMDAEGRDYIRNIRAATKSYESILLDSSSPETSFLPFHGYIWEENGKIIGNLTLIPVRRRLKDSYFIANVAVHPDHRGKGIARMLTDRAIAHVREHRGKQIFLQVREDNQVAVHIYQSHGFEEIARRTLWNFDRGAPAAKNSPGDIRISSRRKEDWSQQRVWLNEIYPPTISWNLPFYLEKMAPTLLNWLDRFLSGETQRTWSVRNASHLLGTITLEKRGEPYDYLWVATSPVWENLVIQTGLPAVLRSVLNPKKLAINYPAGRAVQSFHNAGMVESNTLIWMKNSISNDLFFSS
jgi:ribosomal protein S18 acetylase RimI-like enzyme